MEAFETFEHAGYTIELHYDDNPMSPREDCNLTEMICWHKRYDLGDRQPDGMESEAIERASTKAKRLDLSLLEAYLRRTRGAIAFAPLGLYDHSGITMYVGGGPSRFDAAGWDSGTVGFAYITRERWVELMGETVPYDGSQGNPTPDEAIRQEVATYDQYLRNEVVGYEIVDDKGDHVGGCWGFFPDDEGDGLEYIRQEARGEAESARDEAEAKANRTCEAWYAAHQAAGV